MFRLPTAQRGHCSTKVQYRTEIDINLCKHLFTLLCIKGSSFVVLAHDDCLCVTALDI